MAMGWYLNGRVSAVIGTHTHIPTADTRILSGGTAYQTDAGMTGPYNSVIGVDKDIILKRFLTGGRLAYGSGSGRRRTALGHRRCGRNHGQSSLIKRYTVAETADER